MRKSYWIIGAAIAAALGAQPASADTVTDWMDLASRLGNAAQSSPTPQTAEGARATTRTALAMFEAVNAIDRRYQSYVQTPQADASASQDAAAATAAYRVLLHHYPAQRTALEESYALAMSSIAESPAKASGTRIGEAAAQAAIAAGGLDAAVEQMPYRPRTTPGEWIGASLPSLEPHWAALRPWVMRSPDELRAPPPVPLVSERWARDYEEVRRLGGRTSTERTPHQTLVARYRQAFDTMPSLRLVADAPGRTPVRNARMFAVYQMAFDDAAQAMIVAKLHYNYWRPITAIRNGASDGNDATPADPAWVPLLATPNFPEYPCGHCTVAAVVAELMTAETGNSPPGGVRIMSQAIPISVVQTFPSWDAWAQEVSDSRIYGGVHFRFSNEAGEQIGRRAARLALERVLQPLPAAGRRRR
ncbi:MAG TPA: vanadium-dependent haloperoxidase [Allosphingosinicella sp.]|nr:vanadium-dependent haloperoxidase [Allosphingosinicella sp.]